MEITDKMAKEALKVFRVEQRRRTVGVYTGCECDGCVECMKIALQEILKKEG